MWISLRRLCMAVIALAVVVSGASAALIANHRALMFGNAVLPFNGIPFYFNTSMGSDSNNCQTPATACKTISHLNAIALPANAAVLFAGGQTFSGGISLTAANVPQGPITFAFYGNGSPTISSGLSACLLAANLSNVMVTGLTCVSNNVSNATAGISIANALSGNTTLSGPTVTNNTVSGYGFNGIEVIGNNGQSGFNGIKISGNTVHDVTGNSGTTALTACIDLSARVGYGHNNVHSNAMLQGNTVYNCTGSTTASTNWSGSGIFVAETTNATLQHNVAHDFGVNSSNQDPVGVWTNDSTNVTIQLNEAYNGKTKGDGFDCDGGVTNCILQYNFSHDNAGAGLLFCSYNDGTIISSTGAIGRYNIVQNNSANSIGFSANIYVCGLAKFTGLAIYNNTVYAGYNGLALKEAGGTSPSANIANNIFFGVTSTVMVNYADTASTLMTGNDYFPGGVSINWAGTSYASLPAWRSGSSQEELHGVSTGFATTPSMYVPGGGFTGAGSGYDPTYLMAYNLQVGSAVSTVGLDLDAQFGINPGSQDFYGNAIQTTGGSYPIGAAIGDFTLFASSCTQSTNFLARGSGFSKQNNVNYNSLLCGLNSDGDLSNIDALYVLAAPTSSVAALNLISTSDSLVSHGTITFAANQGYTGDGSTGYLDTQFVPSSAGGNFTQNSATIAAYVLNPRTANLNVSEIAGGDVNSYSLIQGTFNGFAGFAVNENSAGDSVGNGNAQGWWIAQRTSASVTQGYLNGATFGGTNADASTGLSTVSLFIDGLNSSGTPQRFAPDTIALAMIGGGTLSAPRTSRRVNSFMTALGLNVY